ncbi:hypothetical protein G6F46_013862 [Rhizopus delemar]|uniref:Uncharacterized protein n=2 Tax=Rhizopus TaxID=4842 RepID=A0A9P6Y0M8_9FUNG|nr:hypothetical protein G6F55_013417 [Rhizopus delemar]KAG1530863.1 hypothetical protein G6F51_013704 [Rhizopus arrhizus]KAG1487168.1 hypothetical protein G6F54_012823 [Rhizopus delemar]KAG1489358.1 hypothetical protein G6F53_013433 [Rhizopus delemar]KAG1493157.1 hypothetical protein G6F52_013272 [Rhizopus delemar]
MFTTERFVVSVTPEIYHQVAAFWMPLRKSNDPTKWNVMEASNMARELLGDVVADYYSFYQTGKFTNGARRRDGGNVPMPSGHTGATERRKTRNVFYGNINVLHSVAGPSVMF